MIGFLEFSILHAFIRVKFDGKGEGEMEGIKWFNSITGESMVDKFGISTYRIRAKQELVNYQHKTSGHAKAACLGVAKDFMVRHYGPEVIPFITSLPQDWDKAISQISQYIETH